ncbi:MAG: UvrD-helicase domain-containing protein [Trichodesmium sp. ALOHA_ZT_67]|nr:UvrD-helicase domain-containing protein [Trichodesmium sp. ALOHA_ZT_67]
MAYHSRGGVRDGAGRPSKAPTKTIRIEENLADKIKKLTTKLESNYILSKWESLENFLLHNQTFPQQDTNNKLPPKLSKALENKALVEMLELIFSKFSPGDFIDYWSDIDLTEIEPISETQLAVSNVLHEATTEKGYTVTTPEVNKVLDVTLEKSEVLSVVEFSDYKNSNGNFLTQEQFNILEAVRDRISVPLRDRVPQAEKKGLLIEALAGTGKSTMLAEIAKVLKSENLSPLECRFVVFGRKNKQDLTDKLSEIKWDKSVQTLNSLGYEMLRDALGKSHKQFRLNNGKYEKIAQDKGYLDSYNKWGEKIPGKLPVENRKGDLAIISKAGFVDLLDKMRLHCYFLDEISSDDVWEIANKYGIEIYKNSLGEITEAVCDILEAGLNDGINKLNIDFLDQIWLLWHDQNVYKNVFNKWSNKLKVISIDECQDTDLLQIEFIKLLHKSSNNFIIAVGDRFQAIYSFRGCLTDGIDVIAKKFNCDKMPLTTNWRCGKKHLKLVRDIYPHIDIKPAPTAPDGEIRIIKENHFLDIFDSADMSLSFFGICRKNAPLLIFAIRLLTAGYPARIKDRNLGAKLLNKVKEVVRGNYDVNTFLSQVDNWFKFQANSINRLPEKVQNQRLTELRDYRDCLVAFFAKFQPKSLNDWKTEIDKIFDESTTTKKIIDLYTIHSGKGGEGHYTFIIYPENMPIEFEKQSTEERQQEQHNIYVALTRCLTRAKGGILWLVLEGKKDPITYPKWLPDEYRQLWKDDKDEAFETDLENLGDEYDIEF